MPCFSIKHIYTRKPAPSHPRDNFWRKLPLLQNQYQASLSVSSIRNMSLTPSNASDFSKIISTPVSFPQNSISPANYSVFALTKSTKATTTTLFTSYHSEESRLSFSLLCRIQRINTPADFFYETRTTALHLTTYNQNSSPFCEMTMSYFHHGLIYKHVAYIFTHVHMHVPLLFTLF